METVAPHAANEPRTSAIGRSRISERRIGRFAVTGISLLAIAQSAYAVRRVWASPGDSRSFAVVLYGACIVSVLLALVLTWRATAVSGAFALSVFLGLLGAVMSQDGLYLWSVSAHLSPAVFGLLDLAVPAFVMFMTAALVRFSALFPDPLDEDSYGHDAVLRGLRVAFLRPRNVWGGAAAIFALAAVTAAIRPTTIRVIRPAMFGIVFGAFLVSGTNLQLAYRNATREGRRRTFWVVEGFVATAVIFAAASLLKAVQMAGGGVSGNWYFLAMLLAFIVLIVCLVIAMFFSGALDPSLAIKRTAIYGLVGVALVFIFVGVENAVQDHLRAWLHWSDSTSGIVIGGTVALTVEPIKHHVTRFCERVLARWTAPELIE